MVVFIGQHNICKTFKYLPKQKTVTRKCNFIDMQVYWAYQIQFIFLDILSVYLSVAENLFTSTEASLAPGTVYVYFG